MPKESKCVIDAETIRRTISRLSYEIVERRGDLSQLAIIGIRTGGEHLAKRIRERIKEIEGKELPLGIIDITLYRDDLSQALEQPHLKGTELEFNISGKRIVLVDDVLFTGRTVRAALDALIDFGRPRCVELAVLIDRGHRELPIRPDYIGKNIPTQREDRVHVFLEETDGEDGVFLV